MLKTRGEEEEGGGLSEQKDGFPTPQTATFNNIIHIDLILIHLNDNT